MSLSRSLMQMFAIVAVASTAVAKVQAQTIRLNDSGQTSCYDAGDSPVMCDATTAGDNGSRPHQDGRYGRDPATARGATSKIGGGVAGFDFSCILWNGTVIDGPNCPAELTPNFGVSPSADTTKDWACTKDNVTGLVWSLAVGTTTWGAATSTSSYNTGHNTPIRCGFDRDWRAPTRRELFSIFNGGPSIGPFLDESYFPQAQAAQHWTADQDALEPSKAWVIGFDVGYSITISKTASALIRLVHRSDPIPSASFTVNDNGTVTDNNSALTWDRCQLGSTGSTCAFGVATNYNWADALAQVSARNRSNYLGFDDWRLPNVSELETLVKIDAATSPAIDAAVFPLATTAGTWTSTTFAPFPTFAWIVDGKGAAGGFSKANIGRVRLVRGGQPTRSFDAFAPILNIDKSDTSTAYDASTDGVLLIRFLLGFREGNLVQGALGANPQRDAIQIASHISNNLSRLDVDGDGAVRIHTDGLLIFRRLLGLSGSVLTNGANNGTRTAQEIADAIDALKP